MINNQTLEGLSKQALALFPHYYAFDSINSTNSWLLAHKTPGSICLAKQQTAGKGTKGRQWYSDSADNLLFSFSLAHKYDQNLSDCPPISLLAGIACCEALAELGMTGQGIKWPNDIYCGNKKLAGILVEVSDHLSYWVVGIGMNVNSVPNAELSRQAIYVNEYLDIPVSPERIAAAILTIFSALYRSAGDWQKQWKKWDILLGQDVLLLKNNKQTCVRVSGLTPTGELIVEHGGELTALSSGEVSIRGFMQNDG